MNKQTLINIKLINQVKDFFTKIPRWAWFSLVVLGAAVIYGIIFLTPKTIQFSYASPTCTQQFIFAPQTQKVSSGLFDIELSDRFMLGKIDLFSTKLCISPTKLPTSGNHEVSVAPFGSLIGRHTFKIKVPTAPLAKISNITSRPISTAEPFEIELSSADIIHQYSLAINNKITKCSQATEGSVRCDVSPLALAHGTTYNTTLLRSYKTVEHKVAEGSVTTLQPLILSGASVNEGKMIYDSPTSFEFNFDQPVKDATVVLLKKVNNSTENIKLQPTFNASKLVVNFSTLSREASYELKLERVIATNGSSLEKPVAINFQTSGGPKPVGVSVGANSVARSANIIVTFDQPIAGDVDIAKIARIEGVNGAVRKSSDTQLSFAIQGGDCSAFKLVVDKGLKSGSNAELSKESWSFSSRTICGTSWSIGNSVNGRGITAYSFGTGSSVTLFTAGIHGSEPSGTSTMQAWVQYLQAYGDIVPANKRIVIVPNVNPDGIALGSRNNANNVNIGRNFPTANWQAEIQTTSGLLPTGGGTFAGSEPEAAALIALTRQLRPRLEVSFHAQGRLVGANKFADSVSIGNTYASIVGYKTMYYNAEAVMGYPMTGEYEDWMGEEMNIPAILIELPSHSGNYLNSQLGALKKIITL